MVKNIKQLLIAFLGFILLICANVILVFKTPALFSYFANKNNLAPTLGLTKESLLADYTAIIDYISNPFIYKLNFENFTLSSNGAFHFFEVKKIFFILLIIAFCILIFFFILFLYKKFISSKKTVISQSNNELLKTKKYFNYISLTISIFLILISFINFNAAFNTFHRLIFNNDFWIFNSTTDSIINALPEDYFMFCGFIIIVLFIIELLIVNLVLKRKVED